MIRNLNLLKVTLVSLTAIPTISGTVRREGNDFPSITVLENGKETDYILPDWYQEWVLMNWAMNDEVFPSWVEFGKLENGNYYAEFLDDEGDFMKQSTDQKQPKIVKELKDKWLETMEKLRGKE
jgi:hypothetical protein